MKHLGVSANQPEPRIRSANKRIATWESQMPADPVRTLRIIVAGLIGGVVVFLALALLAPIGESDENRAAEPRVPVLSYVALGYGVVSLAAAPMLAALITSSGRQRLAARIAALQDTSNGEAAEAGRRALAGLYMTRTIASRAALEGAALLLAVSYMIEQEILTVPLVALLIVALALHFPSRDRVERWTDGELRQIEQDRMSAGSAF